MHKKNQILSMFAATSAPWQHRAALLRNLLEQINPQTEAVVKEILDRVSRAAPDAQAQAKVEQLNALLKEMQEGPRRQAVFIELLPAGTFGSGVSHALVVLDDGTYVYTVVPDETTARALRLGDRVVLEGKGRALLNRAGLTLKVGEEAIFERRIDNRHIEVTVRGAERAVVLAAQELMDRIQAATVAPGTAVVLHPRQTMAIDALPPQDELSHFRFLDKGAVPDVHVDRHIGAPPKCIAEVRDHVRLEMTHPALRRSYRLRRCMMKLLCGASGTGKTLAVQAIHRELYTIMSEVTETPVEQLPPRVFRFRSSKVLSMWLGESDKNLDRLFDEIELLAAQEFTAPDGRKHLLPVLVIIEEADGMGRARGQEAIYDRLLTTALQRLDPNRQDLGDKLIVFLATTNEPQIVDPAFLRRIGGSIEAFGRLSRRAFQAVLQKHLTDLPAAADNGFAPEELRRQFTRDLTAWLFSPNGTDPGLVELTFAGATVPVVKHRRDFLTGALVDRAVQQAATEACLAELHGGGPPGITLDQLMRAFDEQIRGIVSQLHEQSAGNYLDLPDGVRVATLRRLPQPTRLPTEYQRPHNT